MEQVQLPPVAISEDILNEFEKILGKNGYSTEKYARLLHCRGKSYRDLLVIRTQNIPTAPDVILFPKDEKMIIPIPETMNQDDDLPF